VDRLGYRVIDRFYIHTVQVLRTPITGSRYNPVANARDWTAAVVVWTGKGWLAPKGAQAEVMANREETTSNSWVFTTNDCPAVFTDRLLVNGNLFQITGNPITAYRPSGLHHLEIKVEEVNG
jgi:hypothetical protein